MEQRLLCITSRIAFVIFFMGWHQNRLFGLRMSLAKIFSAFDRFSRTE
jgi:hypothetical protein